MTICLRLSNARAENAGLMKNNSSRCIRTISVISVILCALCATAQKPLAKVEGVVKEGGKPFTQAFLIATDSEVVWTTKTDAQGEFMLFLPSGCYDLILTSQYFPPKTKQLCIQSGQSKKFTFKVRKEYAPEG